MRRMPGPWERAAREALRPHIQAKFHAPCPPGEWRQFKRYLLRRMRWLDDTVLGKSWTISRRQAIRKLTPRRREDVALMRSCLLQTRGRRARRTGEQAMWTVQTCETLYNGDWPEPKGAGDCQVLEKEDRS